jgi:hypothetical protein
MRLPRVRFTVQRMMAAVAVAAVFLGLIAKFPDWSDRRRHRFLITRDEYSLDCQTLVSRDRIAIQSAHVEGRVDPRLLSHFRFMKDKYEAAARYPWLPVWPDPPEPE